MAVAAAVPAVVSAPATVSVSLGVQRHDALRRLSDALRPSATAHVKTMYSASQ